MKHLSSSPSHGVLIAWWGLRILLATIFALAAAMKLSGQQMMVAEFAQIGLGQWFRYMTGAIELVGAVLLLMPRVAAMGAVLLLAVDAGALMAQVFLLHGDVVHVIVIAALLASILYLQRRLTLTV